MTALTSPVLDLVAAPEHRGIPDFVILHKGACGCRSDGHVRDAFYAQDECLECWQPYGFNVPIVEDEGRLRVHLACSIAAEIAAALADLGPCPTCEQPDCDGCVSGTGESYADRDAAMRVEGWQTRRAAILEGRAA